MPNVPKSPHVFRNGWYHFRCVLVGHLIYVHGGHRLVPCKPTLLYTLDVRNGQWRHYEIRGDLPESINGNSAIHCDDKMISISPGKHFASQPTTIPFIDLPLMTWCSREAYTDTDFKISKYAAADYWEEKRIVLINSDTQSSSGFNQTLMLNVDSFEVRELNAKGPRPTRRYHHGHCFLEDQRKWVIVGGEAPLSLNLHGDIYILSLTAQMVATWTRINESLLASFGINGTRVPSVVYTHSTVLIVGGVRRGRENEKILKCDFRRASSRMRAVRPVGTNQPYDNEFRFHQLVPTNQDSFYLIGSKPGPTTSYYYGECRLYT